MRPRPVVLLAALAALPACGPGTSRPASPGGPGSAGGSGGSAPDPAPTAGRAPVEVIDDLAAGKDSERTCFGWSTSGAVVCAVSSTSIQGGADLRVRVLGPGATELPYYEHPDDEQFFDLEPSRLDRAALAEARALVAAGGFHGWAGPDLAIEPGATVTVGHHALRRTRTQVGVDGDDVTGSWPTYQDVLELRCGARWVTVPLAGNVFAHPVGETALAAVAFGDQLLVTGSVSWGIEGDHGGGTDAALVDAAGLCR